MADPWSALDSSATLPNVPVEYTAYLSDLKDHGNSPTAMSKSLDLLAVPSKHLSLPMEVWGMIIKELRNRRSQDELANLWMTVRNVSIFFKIEVEKLFVEEHLVKMWLLIECGKSHPMGLESVPLSCGVWLIWGSRSLVQYLRKTLRAGQGLLVRVSKHILGSILGCDIR